MQERNDMRGQLCIEVRDSEGRIIQTQQCSNRIVKTGRLLVAHLFGGSVPAGTDLKQVTYLAVGEGADNDVVADSDATLKVERMRKPFSVSINYSDFTDKDSAGKDVQRVKASITTTFDYKEANGTAPLREAGLFTDDNSTPAKAGTMYNRVIFDPVKKSESFQLTLLWEIIF